MFFIIIKNIYIINLGNNIIHQIANKTIYNNNILNIFLDSYYTICFFIFILFHKSTIITIYKYIYQ